MIFLASYPGSGNTMVRILMEAYETGGVRFPKLRLRHDDMVPYLWQRVAPKPLYDLSPAEAILCRSAVLAHMMETMASPAYVKTHTIYGEVGGIPTFPAGTIDKAIYIVRDPRDVVCSYAHKVAKPHDDVIEFLGDPKHVMPRFVGKLGEHGPKYGLYHFIGSWPVHVDAWTTAPVPVHVIRYEDLVADTATTFADALKFLGIEVEIGRLGNAVAQARFDSLQSRERTEGFAEAFGSDHPFFRKGKAGSWREELSDEQVARIEEICGTMMVKLGYDVTRTKEAAE